MPHDRVHINVDENEIIHEGEYDPFKHRKFSMYLTDSQAVFTLLKCSLGTGILAMPMAFSCAGIVLGSVGTLIIGYICTHCAMVLVEQSQMICRVTKKPSLTYGETVREALVHGPQPLRKYADLMKVISDLAMSFTYLGTCCIYVSLMADSVEQILHHEFDLNLGKPTYCFLIMVPLLLLVQIRHLNQLSPLSMVGALLLVAVCGICFYFVLDEGVSFERTVAVARVNGWPLFISTVIFAMEGVGVVMPVENRMANPENFHGTFGVLNRSLIFVVIIYASLGFFGYARYGRDVLGSITLNLDQDMIAAKVAKVFIVLAVLMTYPLQYYVASSGVWYYLEPGDKNGCKPLVQTLFLASGVVLSVIVAAVTPKLEALIELVGAIFFSSLGLLFPVLIETIFMWDRDLGAFKWKLWKNIFIGLFSLTTLACGVGDAVRKY